MITAFSGEHRWLSNFWPAQVEWEGLTYATVEHAYQAAKFPADSGIREAIRDCSTPGKAKRLAHSFADRMSPDYQERKLAVMEALLRAKFALPGLRDQLLSTGDQELVEGNTWNDTFWGVCRGKGTNHLGRLLMQIRKELTA